MYVDIKKSTNKEKKLMAIFYNNEKQKIKTTHFGASGYSDFTQHKDEERKQRYLERHKKNENWDDYTSAGSLSRYILWHKPTLKASIEDYKKRFKLL
jgi:type III secretory pathway component EscR